jgi:diguanylate cyclase (GGDEF)-like protein
MMSRAAFLSALESQLQPQPSHPTGSALFLLRIDRFGGLADTLGYKKTDQVLERVGNQLQRSLRSAELLAALELGTYAIWMPNAAARVEVLQLAQRLSKASEINIEGLAVPVSFSVACALYPEQAQSLDDLLSCAYDALLVAKRSGGNQVRLGEPKKSAAGSSATSDWSLQNTLSKAIESSSLSLHYQPVVNLQTRQWVAVEALLRHRVKELAGISTDSIMGMAESLPILGELTRWGLVEACTAAKAWFDKTGRWLPVAVNLPGQVLGAPALIQWVEQALTNAQMPAQLLTLELTERSLIDADGLTRLRLNQLRALGCVLAMDDFGVGHATLAQLIRLPIAKVKFDRSLIAGLGLDPKADVMMKHLLVMMSELGLQTVAEGIETEEQARLLEQLGCQAGQGYLFSVPLNADAIKTALVQSPGVS